MYTFYSLMMLIIIDSKDIANITEDFYLLWNTVLFNFLSIKES